MWWNDYFERWVAKDDVIGGRGLFKVLSRRLSLETDEYSGPQHMRSSVIE